MIQAGILQTITERGCHVHTVKGGGVHEVRHVYKGVVHHQLSKDTR